MPDWIDDLNSQYLKEEAEKPQREARATFGSGVMPALVAGVTGGGLGRAYAKLTADVVPTALDSGQVDAAARWKPDSIPETVAYSAGDMVRKLPIFIAARYPALGGAVEGMPGRPSAPGWRSEWV